MRDKILKLWQESKTFKKSYPDRVGSVSCLQGRPQATYKDTEAQRTMTENEIGIVVVGLYSRQDARTQRSFALGIFIFLSELSGSA